MTATLTSAAKHGCNSFAAGGRASDNGLEQVIKPLTALKWIACLAAQYTMSRRVVRST